MPPEETRNKPIEPTRRLRMMKWIAKAAEHGDGHAQANLAALYEAGRGVPHDLTQAYKWHQLSQRSTRLDQSDQLRRLANAMSSDQITDAERMVTEWQPAQNGNSAEGVGSMADLLE